MLPITKAVLIHPETVGIVPPASSYIREKTAGSTFPISSRCILYGICFLSIITAVAFGGEPPWAVLMLRSGAAVLFIVWLLVQIKTGLRVNKNPLFAPMMAFAILVGLQILCGTSVYQYATISAAAQYACYGLLLFLTVQCASHEAALGEAALIFTVFGFLLSLFAVIQDLTSHGTIFWSIHPGPEAVIYGPYVNHNHYAGMMEMLTAFPLVISLSNIYTGVRRVVSALCAVFMASTIILSGSRAGILAFAVQLALMTILLTKAARGRIIMIACIALLVFALAFWLAGDDTFARVSTLRHPTKEPDFSFRLKVAEDSLKMIAARPFLGWGLNSFAFAYPQYRSFYSGLEVGQAHGDYVQLTVETGILGLAVIVWYLVCLYRRGFHESGSWQFRPDCAVRLGALLGCTGIVVHSLADFNLQIPANAACFFILCALATTAGHRPRNQRWRRAQAVTGWKVENVG